jgi:hypothetical protein
MRRLAVSYRPLRVMGWPKSGRCEPLGAMERPLCAMSGPEWPRSGPEWAKSGCERPGVGGKCPLCAMECPLWTAGVNLCASILHRVNFTEHGATASALKPPLLAANGIGDTRGHL